MSPSAILCADWGKESRKRAVYAASVQERRVLRLPSDAWSLAAVLETANRWSEHGPVLATFDVPLGIPESYLAAASNVASRPMTTFLELLAYTSPQPAFFRGTTRPGDWTVKAPFFSVPGESGGLRAYESEAAKYGVNLYRRIDRQTCAKSLFVKSGIPGTVGTATCALWQELGRQLGSTRSFSVWPFEGELQVLLALTPVVIGEVYPRAAYATALLEGPVGARPRLTLAKTKLEVRRDCVATLQTAEWVRRFGVTLEDVDQAEANEDDFDSCLTAAALLRCVLETLPMHESPLHAPTAEGGILGTGSVNMALPELGSARLQSPDRPVRRPTRPAMVAAAPPTSSEGTLRCPIDGCPKTWPTGRGGWDGHVGAIRIHPQWHPTLTDPDERRKRFCDEFPEFFGHKP